ncbi:hypothetical protein SCP_0504350 [Sparassis crispa]|uniref:Aminoglycoside phosphotransferase domain-containing protein n=1 Tax=Sparassis crispa TaxID=139825 RepID=A0A401GMD2_9APHY|nr:hypothetical protein SCP_0504350 [Sparassis crispa]GBE83387.1 hypothetical protein SCP_0504350 [Sparassis crispa]
MPAALTEEDVIALCAQSGPKTNRCVYPVVNPAYFIKYGGSHTMGEALTQKYVYRRTTDVPRAPRMPKVYRAFERGPRTYIVMEFINAPTVDEYLAEYPSEAEYVYPSIASALSWLLDLPLPQYAGLGPVGGGLAVHKFFGADDDLAPLEFADALKRTPGRGDKASVDFESEERCFYHSDIREPNFLYNPETGELSLIDFQHVGILTTSFVSYALHGSNDTFVRDMAARITFPKLVQLPAMGCAASILMQFGGSNLGLNEQGLPMSRRQDVQDPENVDVS